MTSTSIIRPDLILQNFTIQNISEKFTSSFLRISFSLKNMSNQQNYVPLSAFCKVSVMGARFIEGTIPFNDGLGWYSTIPSISNGMHHPQYVNFGIQHSQSISFSQDFELSHDSVGRVEDQFGTSNRRGTITLEVEIIVPVVARRCKEEGQPDQYICCKYYFPYQLESSQWIDWLRIWGFKMRLVTMPEEVYLRIQEQMKQSGFIKEWEVISAALTKSKNLLPYSVISIKRNNSSQMIVKMTITNLIVSTNKRIYIAVQMIDNSLLNELIAAIDRGLDVRIVIGKYEAKWLHSRDRRGVFISTLSQKISLRIKDDFHGRMIIIDDVIFVGSVDLDNQGLSVHDNIVVQTQDATAVARGIETFLELEKESKLLELNNEHSRDN